MTPKEFTALRERCLDLVKEELKKNYDGEQFDDLVSLVVRLKSLPPATLVIETFRGIIGYHMWLLQENRSTESFVETAIHDFIGCLRYDRNDGYIPRTNSYIQFCITH